MRTRFLVIDTSVLVHDPNSYKTFSNANVIIPIVVLEELDKLKKSPNETGKCARVAIRNLDDLSNNGEIHVGIKIDNNILVKIDTFSYGSIGSDPSYGDSQILACAVAVKSANQKSDVILVSRDINLRVRARALGLKAEDYEKDGKAVSDLYEGHRVIENEEAGLTLFSAGVIRAEDYEIEGLHPNECMLFTDKKGKGIAPGRSVGGQIKLIKDIRPWNLELRNKEQLFAAEMIMDRSIHLVSMIGLSGSGKTLTAISCALDLVINKKQYENFVIYRPIQPMGNDIGYTPGLIKEKLEPWFSAVDDSFKFLLSDKSRKSDGWKSKLHQFMDNGTIQKEALTYIRGRSIANSLILIDEGQNLSSAEMKTIITRIGQGSKIIVTGDVAQIDTEHLDASNNGLTYIVDKFKNSELVGHVTMNKGERSLLATLASEIL